MEYLYIQVSKQQYMNRPVWYNHQNDYYILYKGECQFTSNFEWSYKHIFENWEQIKLLVRYSYEYMIIVSKRLKVSVILYK